MLIPLSRRLTCWRHTGLAYAMLIKKQGSVQELHQKEGRPVMTKNTATPPIAVDQLVFLRNRVQGRSKIQDSRDSTPYRGFQVPQDGGAVYAVEPADGAGEPRRIHRSALRYVLDQLNLLPPSRPNSSADLTYPEAVTLSTTLTRSSTQRS